MQLRPLYEISSDAEPFVYNYLDFNKAEFRLVKTEPTSSDQPDKASRPRCTIERFAIDSAPEYKAVSYMWGTTPQLNRIEVNGRYLRVSDNLFAFLSQWQEDCGPKAWLYTTWLWIDQICIDQSNVIERNNQVSLMGAIFSNAAGVLAWLGEGEEDETEGAVSTARWLLATKPEDPPEMMSFLRAFQIIASNPYWSRLWIIQEFVLAQNVEILSGCGHVSSVRFRELARAVAGVDNTSAIARIWPFLKARKRLTAGFRLPRMALRPLSEGLEQEAWTMQHALRESFLGVNLQYTWHDVMSLAKEAECRDVRDRVFGMLSLVKQEARVKVDYQAPVSYIREQVIDAEIRARYDEQMSREDLFEDDEFQQFVEDLDVALGLRREDDSFEEWI